MPPTPPFIVLDVPLEVEDEHGELVPVTVDTLRGNSILSGEGAPVEAEGVEGDFYLDRVTAHLYGPKGAEKWPGGFTSLVGPEGKEGPPGSSELAPESVTTPKIAASAVTAAKLGAEAVETAAIKNLAVTSGKLAAGSVVAAKLGAEAVETAALQNLAVTTGKLAAGAVTAAKLGAEAVEEGAIKAGAVTAGKIGAGAVTAAKLGAEAVEAAAIKTGAVTSAKLAAGAVVAAALGAEAVETAALKAGAVTEAKLAAAVIAKFTTITASEKAVAYELVVGDAGKVIEATKVGGTLIITVPTNATAAIPVGSVIELCQVGTGILEVKPAAGVTMHSPGGSVTARVQYSSLTLRKRAENEWLLAGDLT